MFDHFHLGNEVGEFDEFILGVPAGDDHMFHVRLQFQNFDDLFDGQVIIAQRYVLSLTTQQRTTSRT
jgi:hypothetical protein